MGRCHTAQTTLTSVPSPNEHDDTPSLACIPLQNSPGQGYCTGLIFWSLQWQGMHAIDGFLLACLHRSPHQVQVQLGEVFKTVVYADYPTAWPSLLQDLCTCLASQVGSTCHLD